MSHEEDIIDTTGINSIHPLLMTYFSIHFHSSVITTTGYQLFIILAIRPRRTEIYVFIDSLLVARPGASMYSRSIVCAPRLSGPADQLFHSLRYSFGTRYSFAWSTLCVSTSSLKKRRAKRTEHCWELQRIAIDGWRGVTVRSNHDLARSKRISVDICDYQIHRH